MTFSNIQAAKKMAGGKDSKYTKSAKTMMLFVAVYIAQWWSYVTYAVWNLFAEPHVVIMVASVLFSNLGGMFNLLTYILMKRQRKVGTTQKTAAPVSTVVTEKKQDKKTLIKPATIAESTTTSE